MNSKSNKVESENLKERDREYMEWWDSIAFEYESKVLSPLYSGVKNPIWDFLGQLNTKDYKKALDLGCGTGKLLDSLSQHFEEVWGIDWSKNMLQIAESTNSSNKNVRLKRMDIRNLEIFYDYFDAIFSINTIASYSFAAARQMLEETFKALRVGGLFVAIFPAFDAVLYQRELTYEAYVEEGLAPSKATQKADDYFVRRNKLNLKERTYADDGVHDEKMFTEDEIPSLLQALGFKDIITKKVLYPWDLCKKYGYGYFPDKPEIWDWFSIAHKQL